MSAVFCKALIHCELVASSVAGVCCAASCVLLGAAVVVVADVNAARLEKVKQLGPVIRTLDLSRVNTETEIGQALQHLIGHQVVDCGCECVGFECSSLGHGKHATNKQETVMNVGHSLTLSLRLFCADMQLQLTRSAVCAVVCAARVVYVRC